MRIVYVLITIVVSAGFLISGNSVRQQPAQPKSQAPGQSKQYMDEGVVEHKGGAATLRVSDPRPLKQAIATLNEEYGWIVDYEDPPYMSDADLIDVTDPQRRAADPKARVTIPSGDGFQFDYDESPLMTSRGAEAAILHQMVAAYNRTNNPGRFVVREQDKGRYTVIGASVKNQAGKDQNVESILDTPISISVEKRSSAATIDVILKELSARTNTKIGIGWVPNNLLFNTQATVGGNNVSARSLLLQTFEATGRLVVYNLMYFENTQRYLLGATVAVRAQRDSYGKKTLIPIDASPKNPN